MVDIFMLSENKNQKGRKVVNYKLVKKLYDNFVKKNGLAPTIQEFSSMLCVDESKARNVAIHGKHSIRRVEKFDYTGEEFAIEYEKMCEGDYKPSVATVANRLGLTHRQTSARITIYHKKKMQQEWEEEHKKRFDHVEVYATSDTMRMLVERANGRANG